MNCASSYKLVVVAMSSGSGDSVDAMSREVAALQQQLRDAQSRLQAAHDKLAAPVAASSPSPARLVWLREALSAGIEHEQALFDASLGDTEGPAVSPVSTGGAGAGSGAGAHMTGVGSASSEDVRQLRFRVAQPSDMADVHRMIQELADFEKEPDAVDTTIESLTADGFGTEAVFVAFVGVSRGCAVSFGLLHPTFSTWKGRTLYLEDLYVMPEFRRKGVGERMLRCMAAAARFGRCARLHWQVLDWNRKAISVYDRIGAQNMASWLSYRLDAESIAAFAKCSD